MESLESSVVRPRQARYQAALRPDMKYVVSRSFARSTRSILLTSTHRSWRDALDYGCTRIQRHFASA